MEERMAFHRRIYLGLMVAIGGATLVAMPTLSSSEQSQLRLDWQTRLGDAYPQRLYRVAVCQDGGAYVSDGKGELVSTGADGSVVTRRHVEEFASAMAIICPPDGGVVAAVFDRSRGNLSLSTLSATSDDVSTVWMTPTQSRAPHAMVSSGDGVVMLFAAPPKPTVYMPAFARYSMDGREIGRFGSLPLGADVSRASITWSPRSKELLLIPGEQYSVHSYSDAGMLKAVTQKGVLNAQSVMTADNVLVEGDRILGAVTLSNGNTLVQVVRRQGPTKGAYLELLSESLEVVSTGTSMGYWGKLVGTDGKSLYFAVGNPKGFFLTKATLTSQ